MKPACVLTAVLPFAAFLTACAKADADDGSSRPYKVGVVDRGEVRVTVEETGVVEPERRIVVKSPISGVVQQLYVREGDRVQPGQVLARILPDIAQANSLAQLRSEIARAQIARDNAKREYDRAQTLSSMGGITQADLDQRRVGYEQAENEWRTAQDQLRLVQLSGVTAGDSAGGGAQWARIIAPAAGVIIGRGVEEGETVVGGTSAFGGGTELFTMADLSTLLVKAAINEVDIGKVKRGDRVALTVDAFPGDTAQGVVRLVPPAARQQERVRVFDVEIEVTGGARVLRPGMTANVRISGPVRSEVARVPVEAVLLQEGKPVVYKIGGSGPQPVAVTLGLSDLFFVEIVSGLVAGDSIALEDPVAAVERARSPARRR
ncbi:MAG TPA: efflux RND transporter periplasmic adaptor subunit [Gemmatimonadales bacterium]|jgi:HlyD family secretion protein|nr:efflux RND transporter periplasmic adaptor subunit [Gemmatimonadales bacterium]